MPVLDPSIPAILMSSHHPSQPLYLRVRYGVSSQVCPTSLWLPEWEEIFMDRTCYLVPIRTLSVLSKYSLFNFLKDPSDTARIIVLTYTPSSWGTVSLTSPVEATVTSVQSLQYRVSCNYIIRLLWWHHSYQRSQLLRTGTAARTGRVRSASWRIQDWYWDTFWQIMRYTDMLDMCCVH